MKQHARETKAGLNRMKLRFAAFKKLLKEIFNSDVHFHCGRLANDLEDSIQEFYSSVVAMAEAEVNYASEKSKDGSKSLAYEKKRKAEAEKREALLVKAENAFIGMQKVLSGGKKNFHKVFRERLEKAIEDAKKDGSITKTTGSTSLKNANVKSGSRPVTDSLKQRLLTQPGHDDSGIYDNDGNHDGSDGEWDGFFQKRGDKDSKGSSIHLNSKERANIANSHGFDTIQLPNDVTPQPSTQPQNNNAYSLQEWNDWYSGYTGKTAPKLTDEQRKSTKRYTLPEWHNWFEEQHKKGEQKAILAIASGLVNDRKTYSPPNPKKATNNSKKKLSASKKSKSSPQLSKSSPVMADSNRKKNLISLNTSPGNLGESVAAGKALWGATETSDDGAGWDGMNPLAGGMDIENADQGT